MCGEVVAGAARMGRELLRSRGYRDEHQGNGANITPDKMHQPYTGANSKDEVLT